MFITQLEDCYEFAFAALDGVYGWVSEAVSIIILVVVFNILINSLLKRLHLHFAKQDKYWKDSFVTALYQPLSYYIWYVAILHAIDLISHRVLNHLFFENMHLLMSVGLVLSLAWFLLRWKKNIIRHLSAKSRTGEIVFEPGKVDVINKISTILIIFTTLLLLLEVTDRSVNTLIAFGGVGGLAIAFASQEIVANFFGGLMIYLTHPFAIGDWVNLPERSIEGYVEEIGWYMTRIRTFEKRPLYIPNSIFTKVVVMTPSRMSHRQFKEKIGIRYSDMPVAKKVIGDIKEMLRSHPAIDHQLNFLVYLASFNTYSVDISISAYTLTVTTEGFASVKEDLLFKIYDILNQNGAEMPFPVTQIEMRTQDISSLKTQSEPS